MTDFDDAADPVSETLEQRLRAKAEQIRHDRPDTLGTNLSVLLLEAAATIAAVTEPDERTLREGVNAARDLWVDGAEFDDAVSMGIGVAFGLAVGEQSAIAEGSVGELAALRRSPPELTGAESPQHVAVPEHCPECNGNGSAHRMFDGNCPSAWAHPFISAVFRWALRGETP